MARRILVVDDEPDILELTRLSLAREGYEVETAATGEEALASLRRGRPDLVVLDLMLPDRPGTDVCRSIRTTPELADVPVTHHALMPGDRLVFYSDGITERQGPGDSFFELERLIAVLGTMTAEPPQAIADRLVLELDAFAEGVEPEDDQTILVGAIAR